MLNIKACFPKPLDMEQNKILGKWNLLPYGTAGHKENKFASIWSLGYQQ